MMVCNIGSVVVEVEGCFLELVELELFEVELVAVEGIQIVVLEVLEVDEIIQDLLENLILIGIEEVVEVVGEHHEVQVKDMPTQIGLGEPEVKQLYSMGIE